MELIKTLLEQQPLMALFLTIAIGYLVGEINVKGFSLGVGAVLFLAGVFAFGLGVARGSAWALAGWVVSVVAFVLMFQALIALIK